MLTLKIKEENYRKFVEETSRKREDWIKSISDSAVVIMERQRYLMGMSKQEFYGVFLGCPMNSRTYRKIIEKQILVPENLLLSFCFTYGYDLKRFQEVSKLIDTHDYFENYQQIGAAVECLGKGAIYQLAAATQTVCTDTSQYARRRCGEALTAFAKKKEYDEEVIRNPEIIEAAAASVIGCGGLFLCSEESVSNREQLIHVSLVRYGCLCGYRSGRNIRNKAWLRCGSRLYRGRLLNNRSGCRRLYGFRLGLRCGCYGFREIPVQDRFHRIFHGAADISFRHIRCAGFFSLAQ